MPTSNVTRVRSDGFSKISAMNLPCSVEAYRIGRALMSAESWSNSRVCAGLHSAPVRRSFDKEMGATSVVAVIFHFTLLSHGRRAADPRTCRNPKRGSAARLLQERFQRAGEIRAPARE